MSTFQGMLALCLLVCWPGKSAGQAQSVQRALLEGTKSVEGAAGGCRKANKELGPLLLPLYQYSPA